MKKVSVKDLKQLGLQILTFLITIFILTSVRGKALETEEYLILAFTLVAILIGWLIGVSKKPNL